MWQSYGLCVSLYRRFSSADWQNTKHPFLTFRCISRSFSSFVFFQRFAWSAQVTLSTQILHWRPPQCNKWAMHCWNLNKLCIQVQKESADWVQFEQKSFDFGLLRFSSVQFSSMATNWHGAQIIDINGANMQSFHMVCIFLASFWMIMHEYEHFRSHLNDLFGHCFVSFHSDTFAAEHQMELLFVRCCSNSTDGFIIYHNTIIQINRVIKRFTIPTANVWWMFKLLTQLPAAVAIISNN